MQKINHQALNQFQSNLDGLTQTEAMARLERFGKNQIASEKSAGILRQLFMAFNNPFIYVLLVLVSVSLFTDCWLPMQAGEDINITGIVIILTMIIISGVLKFWQEFRSNKAAEALKSMIRTTALVLRQATNTRVVQQFEIPVSDLVPGDVILLSAGDMVPADVCLIEANNLWVNQSTLTGESLPVEKTVNLSNPVHHNIDALTLYDHQSEAQLEACDLCFMATHVISGTAKAKVLTIGDQTYFGSVAKSIVGTQSNTAFDKGVNQVSWLLVKFMLVMVPVVLVINGVIKGNWSDAILFALAVAVGLTPEMLPMIVTANLAKGAVRMAKHKVVVKRLNAIQNFGAMDILCTDKTGTLTQDRIVLAHHVDMTGLTDNTVFELAYLNSYYQSNTKNLMDNAILSFNQTIAANNQPVWQQYQKIDELPFDFERRRLSVVLQTAAADHILICKGAVEEMLAMASHVYQNGQSIALDAMIRHQLLELVHQYNQAGYRVLALGTKTIAKAQTKNHYGVADETQLEIRGFLTFLDPPKASAKQAIAGIQQQGVAVKVLTGDNAIVTVKLCQEVGLDPGRPLLGSDIDDLTDDELKSQLIAHTIFAKLSPLQKGRIIGLLQQMDHTVGFLGDGINDAPALKQADVGISVDTATDIAQEAADIILLEKSLMVLNKGIFQGRQTFGNIMKYLNMTASSNFGNVFSVLVASVMIPFLPMLAIQLLIQNLLYDISQLSLPWDKIDTEFLKQPRKWDATNIKQFMLWIGPTSSVFDIATFAVMWFVFAANSPQAQDLFHSGWFVEGLLSQTLVVHMLRTQKIPFVQSRAALPVVIMTIMIMIIGIYLPFSPVGHVIGLTPLPWQYFPWLAAILIGYCCFTQAVKHIYLKKFGQWF